MCTAPGVNGVTCNKNLIEVTSINNVDFTNGFDGDSGVTEIPVTTNETQTETETQIEEVCETVEEIAEVEETTEVEEITEVEETNELEEIAEAEEITAVEEIAEVKETTEVEEVAEVEEITEVEEVAEVEETTEVEEITEVVNVEENVEKPTYSAIKRCFSNILTLIEKVYSGVFNKTPNFKPTYTETVNDLTLYIAEKSVSLGAFAKFRVEFSCDETVLIGASNSNAYVPLIIKLTAFIDKQLKSDFTSAVIKDLTKILLELLGENENSTVIISTAMSAIYAYALSQGIKLI